MRHIAAPWSGLAAALLLAAPARADILFYEPFDGTALRNSWAYTFANNAAAWNFGVGGGVMTVTDITPIAFPPGCDVSGASWSSVYLERPITINGDFTVSALINWDSGNSVSAMQSISIELLDCHGTVIAASGYEDAWAFSRGSRAAAIGSQVAYSGANTLPFAGSAEVSIARAGGTWTASFAGQTLLTASAPGVPRTLRVTFQYYASHLCAGGDTFFGTESIDWLEVSGVSGAPAAADLNGDQAVDGTDLGVLLGAWGSADCGADLNQDGLVDGVDLGLLLGAWTL